MGLLEPALMKRGFVLDRVMLPEAVGVWVRQARWLEVDRAIGRMLEPGGELFRQLEQYHTFTSIEFILSIRDGEDPDEEDGIWHDDGSRFLAFTLSLTVGEVEGGRLGIRRRGEEAGVMLETPPYGGMIVYLTGHYGVEHRIHRVVRGRRVVIAGWCSGGE